MLFGLFNRKTTPKSIDHFIAWYEQETRNAAVVRHAREVLKERVYSKEEAAFAILLGELLEVGIAEQWTREQTSHPGRVSLGLIAFKPTVEFDLPKRYPSQIGEQEQLRKVAAQLGRDKLDAIIIYDYLNKRLEEYKANRGLKPLS